jgi:hypothetical protein
MARAGFYNENEYRDYPFLTRVNPIDSYEIEGAEPQQLIALPHDAIVDFGAVMDLDADYSDLDGDIIYLHAIQRRDPYLFYDFRTTAAGAEGTRLLFSRNTEVDPEFTDEWLASTVISASLSSSASAADCAGAAWRGYLVTGRYAEVLELLADGDDLIFTAGLWTVEPARVQNLARSYLRSINLANFARSHISVPEVCQSGSLTSDDTLYVNAECLQGDLKFKEGFNCAIRQEVQNNAIIIGASPGSGAGEPCAEIPLFEGETSPDGSPFLTGGPTCGEIVKTVNGKGGRRLQILSGPGFRVLADPDSPNTIIVDRALEDFVLCLADDEEESVSSQSLGSEA